ncbi:MAG: hypothetical protein K0S32_1597 [Bacteroidetes bacterium]|jgi:hypothetical protein|nr:hypothetical protein [Bacteroidota bacterium]
MKVKLLFAAFGLAAAFSNAQPNISSWHLNTTGAKGKYWTTPGPNLVTMTDSSGITKLCYTSTHVYVRTRSLAFNYTMGPSLNPNLPASQNYTFKLPKTPTQQTGTKTNVPTGGVVGLSINGVILFGNRSADSYKSSTNTNTGSGDNQWHCDAWYNEKTTMDTSGNGHSDQAGRYHYHANPSTLYSDPSTAHSPIIGFALDGYPVYGPFGYTTPTNSASVIKRIESSYQLRSITTRTALPGGATSSPAGPVVSATFPLGMYVEDYEYLVGSGDLDDLNGRYCVTPEYPSGTYAYFMTTDNTGSPAYPYIFASQYYGVISASDMGPNLGNAGMPTSGLTCVTTVTGIENKLLDNNDVIIFPNPATDFLNIALKNDVYKKFTVTDVLGKVVVSDNLDMNGKTVSLEGLHKGIYLIMLTDANSNTKAVRFVKE